MVTSPDTLLRRLHQATLPEAAEVRVLGVDDWVFRRGKRYDTNLINLERRRAVDLLPDRQSSTLAECLRSYPDIELVSRDRVGAYAGGIREGAPQTVQAADRWHLLKNLSEAPECFRGSASPASRAGCGRRFWATDDRALPSKSPNDDALLQRGGREATL